MSRIEFLGAPMDSLSMSESVAHIEDKTSKR